MFGNLKITPKKSKFNDDITMLFLHHNMPSTHEIKLGDIPNKRQLYNTIFAGFGHMLRPFNNIKYFY